MRRIPVESIVEGQILAKPLYNDTGGLLIAKDIPLTQKNIEKIKELGFSCVFINDEYTKDEIIEVIKPTLIKDVMNISTKMLSLSSYNANKKTENYLYELKNIIDEILDEIFSIDEILYSLIDTLRFDDYTYKHSVNVMILSLMIGKKHGLNRIQLKKLAIGSLFHDVGKMFIPKEILNKKGKLTEQEFETIKKHPKLGFDFLKEIPTLSATERIVALEHHERFDGKGYPYEKKDKQIHLYSKIVSICDVFEALISDRPYRKAVPVNEAREYILGGGGSLFDIEVVKTFSETINPFPIGTLVELSNGKKAKVIGVNKEFLQSPIVIIYDDNNKYKVNLKNKTNITIKNIIYNIS